MNKKESARKQKTKKELLEELTAFRQELESVQSTQTDLRKDNEAKEEEGIFLSNIFSNIREGISVLDRDLNIVFVNPNMERWFSDRLPLVGKKCAMGKSRGWLNHFNFPLPGRDRCLFEAFQGKEFFFG
jgi:nitrogen fixation/metabolism regulation signal transduction histidine kinase